MREIKFRAWDKNNKKMVDDMKINVVGTNEVNLNVFFRIESFELMQFTGLKDKNGKEIYEGDIVKTNDDYPEVGEIFWSDDWHSFFIDWVKTPAQTLMTINERSPEVIGNKFENPELLK